LSTRYIVKTYSLLIRATIARRGTAAAAASFGDVPGCCNARGCDVLFDAKVARRDASRYRRKGLDRTARRMVEFLAGRGVAGQTVLEIGGGVGGIALELLKAGAARAVTLELSGAYERPACEVAREAGLEDRVDFRLVDLAADAEAVATADVVILHRVVCCYPEADRLVAAAAGRTRDVLVLSYPPRNWGSRVAGAALNVAMRLLRREYRAYMHPPRLFLAEAEKRGLERVLRASSFPWRIAALERTRPLASVS
jgi:2-polyprenyl-3-methyl-5-hydroxy-6-metoxy-1,4-benzoquinol methylase